MDGSAQIEGPGKQRHDWVKLELCASIAITISRLVIAASSRINLLMFTRLRRTGEATIEFSAKLPINAWSRSVVDFETERLRHSVIPIIGANDRRQPYLVGSAVVLAYRGRKILVTAEHVFSDNEKVPLFFFGSSGYSHPFVGDFEFSKVHDLAAHLLAPAEVDALSHIPFLTESDLGHVAAVGERFYASVAGYPATAAKRKDKVTLDTPMEVYSNFATELIDGSISVVFDRDEGAADKTGHIIPREPFGKSGGAIFGLPVHGRNIKPQQTAKLVGIPTRWKRAQNRIQGASVAVLMPLLDHVLIKADQSAT